MELAGKAQHFIDYMWCDMEGVYVRGWAHCSEVPVTRIYMRCGEAIAETRERLSRADVQAIYPMVPTDLCGYTCYLESPPFRPILLGIETEQGTVEINMDPAQFPHLRDADITGGVDLVSDFAARMKAVKGKVLEIGARKVSPGAKLLSDRFAPECTFIGVDIHAAPGVDIVADAHFLSRFVEPASLDGVFSLAVMEHLAAPWLVAAEINKVLKIGGLTMHAVPHSFPVHETPNDFWRMSDAALQVLFGPNSGFETVVAGMATPIRMTTHRSMRQWPFLEYPLFTGMAEAHIIARKVAHLAEDAVRWPSADFEQLGRSYPAHS